MDEEEKETVAEDRDVDDLIFSGEPDWAVSQR